MDGSTQNIVEGYWEIIRRIARWVLFLAIIAGLIYCLYRIRAVIMFVFLAVILTYILLPGVDWLCRTRNRRLTPHWQRLLATVLVFLVFLSFVAALISVFAVPFSRELGDFTAFVKENFGKYVGQLPAFLDQVSKTFNLNVNLRDFLARPDLSKLGSVLSQLGTWTVQVASSSIRVALDIFLIPVLAFYFVYDYRSITRELYGLVPQAKRRELVRMGRCVGELLQSYIFGQLILCLIAGVATGIFLGLMGIKYAVVLAIFAGITRAIPVIGPIVSGIPIIAVGGLTAPPGQGLPVAIILTAFVIFVHFAESKFIMPGLIGRRMRLHPAVVIIVLLIGAEFFGLVGMFIAAPVAAIIRELILRYYVVPRGRRLCAPPVLKKSLR